MTERALVCALVLAGSLPLAGCGRVSSSGKAGPARLDAGGFKEVTREAGITFVHNSGARGRKYFPETCGSGGAFLDYDNDGRLDILLVNSMDWPEAGSPKETTLALYRGSVDSRFTDVTRQAGLAVPFYGMGCAVGDYDNDGDSDVYVTAVLGPSRLFRNRGNGTFEEVTRAAGVDNGSRWGSSCAWLDYDRDGWLDLFVGNYIRWSPETDIRCESIRPGVKSYCTPEAYAGESCRLYRSNRDATFTDVTRRSGIYNTTGKTLGVAVCDFNRDGWPDLAVANDTQPNFLYQNTGDGHFQEVGLEQGVAFGDRGTPRAGMGIDTAEAENDGRTVILIANFSGEGCGYFREEAGHFVDAAAARGLVPASLPFLGWGALFLDYDLDGWRDAFILNGHIDPDVQHALPTITYAERPLLFRQAAPGRYDEVGERAGFTRALVGRGAAAGDYDNDGDLDLLVTENNGPARLFRNDRASGHHWLRCRLIGSSSNRSAIGARLVVRSGGLEQAYTVRSGGSYASQSDLRVTIGLGPRPQVDEVEVHWPSGTVERLKSPPVDRELEITEGEATGGRRSARG